MVNDSAVDGTQLLVIGGGPGGYAAAFRAADLGLQVTLVSMDTRPGGECLFRGCIPSKTLLYLAELLYDVDRAAGMGLKFDERELDLAKLRAWKEKVVDKMADGLVRLAKKRGVTFLHGRAMLEGSGRVRLDGAGVNHIEFDNAILATGSHPVSLPGVEMKADGRVMDSAGALALPDIPKTLLVVGGGYIALELGSVTPLSAAGSRC
jgi:dihydrolipoamide dehydrogenase